jgi:Concanavalin A-like lectin/glucanases superfamily
MNTWIDLTGHGHDGALTNFAPNPWVGNGTPQSPYALSLDGADDIVKIMPAADGLKFTDELSVEMWVIPEALASYYREIFNARDVNGYNGYVMAMSFLDGYVPNPNSWAWYTCPTGHCPYWADAYSDASASISTHWYHVSGTYSLSAGFARLYVNGVKQKDEHPVSTPIVYGQNVFLSVGNAAGGNFQFQGRIAVVRVWSRALAASEIGDLFAKDAVRFGLAAPPPVLSVSGAGLALHYEAGPCMP